MSRTQASRRVKTKPTLNMTVTIICSIILRSQLNPQAQRNWSAYLQMGLRDVCSRMLWTIHSAWPSITATFTTLTGRGESLTHAYPCSSMDLN